MTLSNQFKQGMKYPDRIKGVNVSYDAPVCKMTIHQAWENTGRLLKEAMDDYAKRNGIKGNGRVDMCK